MAKRTLRPKHQEDIRAKIKGTQLCNMLTEVALTGMYNGHEVNPVRIQAALGLLRKVLPDLSATELDAQVTTFSETLQRIAALREGNVIPITAAHHAEEGDDEAEQVA